MDWVHEMVHGSGPQGGPWTGFMRWSMDNNNNNNKNIFMQDNHFSYKNCYQHGSCDSKKKKKKKKKN